MLRDMELVVSLNLSFVSDIRRYLFRLKPLWLDVSNFVLLS
jgi:hypothetical protein